MSRPPSVSPAAWTPLAAVLLATVVAAAILAHLRATAPTGDISPTMPGVDDPLGRELDVITCQRTLPDVAVAPAGGQPPDPVGIVRSTEVVACPQVFDPDSQGGPAVLYVGEVVGDVLHRDGGAWVLMNDDAYALEDGPLPAHREMAGTNSGLTAWLPDDLQPSALEPGRPGRRGDILAVRGRIHRADPNDGGGLTLRATSAELVARSEPVTPPLHRRQAIVAAAIAFATIGTAAYQRFRVENPTRT